MATDDVMTIDSPCLCGKGQISVTQTSPDHPWVKESQISYDACLNCPVCAKIYQVENNWGGSKPRLVLRSQLDAKAAAESKVQEAEKTILCGIDIYAMRARLISLVDAEKTKAAKHRLAGKLGLYPPSYATFIKQATDGHSLLGRLSGYRVIRAALQAGLEIAAPLKNSAANIERLRGEAYAAKVDTVRTGATWMVA